MMYLFFGFFYCRERERSSTMGAAASVVDNEESILKHASEIYENDPERFERLVQEVRRRSSKNQPDENEAKTEIKVIEEMNFVRTRPQEYAMKLEKVAMQYKGKDRILESGAVLKTTEGTKAVLECANELKRLTKPLSKLSLRMPEGMVQAAQDHVNDTGPKSIIGHIGSDQSNPVMRLERHGTWIGNAGENISYGWDDPEKIVMQLMIDDNVPDRGHRRAILDDKFKVCGVAIGSHKKYGKMCVVTYAGDYAKKRSTKSGVIEASGTLSTEMLNVLNSLPVRDHLKPKVEEYLKQGATISLKYTSKSVEMTASFGSSKSVMKATW
jgi:uncharacterized protein YkwD